MERKKALDILIFKEQEEYEKLSNEALVLKLKFSYGIDEDVK